MSSENTNQQSGSSLLDILEELTERVAQARAMPLSASVLVNKTEILDLLETARDIVPQQIVDADSVLQDASAVTADAQKKAEAIISEARKAAHTTEDQAKKRSEEIVAQAKQEAAQLVAKDAITVAARSEAKKIHDEARKKAQQAKQGADEYSDSTLRELSQALENVQEQIDSLQEQIDAGRSVLAQRLADSDTHSDTVFHSKSRRHGANKKSVKRGE